MRIAEHPHAPGYNGHAAAARAIARAEGRDVGVFGHELDSVPRDYASFLASKRISHTPAGIDVSVDALHSALYGYQRAVTAWALRVGRAAIFADCGLGKTLMQLEWARHVARATRLPTLVVAPLAVADQTIREADIIGVRAVRFPFSTDDHGERPDAVLINYQRLHQVASTEAFGGVVLDESSILKNLLGSVRSQIIDFAAGIPHRLACTATPAPNDLTELLNHAAYLGVMSVQEAQSILVRERPGDGEYVAPQGPRRGRFLAMGQHVGSRVPHAAGHRLQAGRVRPAALHGARAPVRRRG